MKNKKTLNKIVLEVLEERNTTLSKSLDDMMYNLSKFVGKEIWLDDAGLYIVNDIEPHYARIKPITKDIFNLEYVKDRTDRYKFVYISFVDLKKKLRELINSTEKNYVDAAYDKCVQNSKDDKLDDRKTKIPNTDNKNFKLVGNIVQYYKTNGSRDAEDMNDEEDNPDQPMFDADKNKSVNDIEGKKPKYKFPTVPKEFKKHSVKLKKTNKMTKSV